MSKQDLAFRNLMISLYWCSISLLYPLNNVLLGYLAHIKTSLECHRKQKIGSRSDPIFTDNLLTVFRSPNQELAVWRWLEEQFPNFESLASWNPPAKTEQCRDCYPVGTFATSVWSAKEQTVLLCWKNVTSCSFEY